MAISKTLLGASALAVAIPVAIDTKTGQERGNSIGLGTKTLLGGVGVAVAGLITSRFHKTPGHIIEAIGFGAIGGTPVGWLAGDFLGTPLKTGTALEAAKRGERLVTDTKPEPSPESAQQPTPDAAPEGADTVTPPPALEVQGYLPYISWQPFEPPVAEPPRPFQDLWGVGDVTDADLPALYVGRDVGSFRSDD